ncbi:MAG: hypothetical protein AB8F94_17920 [Saprospiraceae bacterium]
MKNLLFTFAFSLLFSSSIFSQKPIPPLNYEPSALHPFGLPNPDAPKEIIDYAPMIGICDCKNLSRNPDGTWKDSLDMIWKFKYIMNGTAVQDELWKENDLYAGSIRQFQKDSAEWIVSYFSYPAVPYTPGIWHGKKMDDKIVLSKPQKAPNGMEGSSILTFYDWDEEGFKWKGEWMKEDKQFNHVFRMIECKKRK